MPVFPELRRLRQGDTDFEMKPYLKKKKKENEATANPEFCTLLISSNLAVHTCQFLRFSTGKAMSPRCLLLG